MPSDLPFTPLTRALPDLNWWTSYFRGEDIPILAETAEALELLRLNEDATDANMLGEMIAADPLMTLKVLAYVANNRPARLITDAETVTSALVLMGITPFFRAFGPQPTVEQRLAGHPEALAGLYQVIRRAERAANFALGFALLRMDHDAPVIYSAALLHDFAEMLLWCHAPALALDIQQRQQADSTLRSAVVQREVLNIKLTDLEQSLMQAWRLPELLLRITDDRPTTNHQVLTVKLAIQLARHTANGWDNAAVPDDVKEISQLINMAEGPTLATLREME
jgi:HD-like signal output (HDOD) protein